MLLDALRDAPKHGYEIIKALEERSSGQYAPSPGTVYPTLQFLEELGLTRVEQTGERRVYHLTDAGRADLDAHADDLTAFWARLTTPAASPASQTEIGFLQEEMEHLAQTVWGGLRDTARRGDAAMIRSLRQTVAQCREQARNLLAGSDAAPDGPNSGENA